MFSITSGWPRRVCNSAAAARMITSVTLPAAIDTTMRIGFDGYCWAWTTAEKFASSKPNINRNINRMALPPGPFAYCYSIT